MQNMKLSSNAADHGVLLHPNTSNSVNKTSLLNVRCAAMTDVPHIIELFRQRGDALKKRSAQQVMKCIKSNSAIVCTATKQDAQQAVVGYLESMVLEEGSKSQDEIDNILESEAGRPIGCRKGDLIFYWGGLVADKTIHGVSKCFLQWLQHLHAKRVKLANANRRRIIFTAAMVGDPEHMVKIGRILESCVSLILQENTPTHKILLPTQMPDKSGRKGMMAIIYVDPPLLPHQQVRLSRNVCLITEGEQRRLLGSHIGIVGLSTGSVALEVLLREGIGGRFCIADHDVFELSNANRMLYGTADEGRSKVDLCAQRIHSVDPLLKIERYSNGVTKENVDSFVHGCDLIIEECDDFVAKLLVREAARKLKVPVLMATSQNGMIDVERYDVDEECRPFHLDSIPQSILSGKPLLSSEKNELLSKLFAKDQFSPRLLEAIPKVGVSVPSWPQLAEEVMLNAATVAHAARRILLGDHGVVSGRFEIRMDKLFVQQNRVFPSSRL